MCITELLNKIIQIINHTLTYSSIFVNLTKNISKFPVTLFSFDIYMDEIPCTDQTTQKIKYLFFWF